MLSACFAWIILVEGFCWRLGHEVWLDQPFLLTSHSVTLVVAKHQANELDGNSNSREIWVYPKDLANVFRACLGSILVQLGEAATKKKIKHLKDTVQARHWYRPLSRKKVQHPLKENHGKPNLESDMRDGFCVWRRGISWHFKIDGSGCLQRKGPWMPFWKNSSLSTFKTRSLGGSHGETASRLITFLVLVCLPNFVAACRSNTTPVLEGQAWTAFQWALQQRFLAATRCLGCFVQHFD